jgi:hypothetical protein
MIYPLLYEINVRPWLRELAVRQGARVSLGSVPEAEFEQWQRLGITHLWLMGVWTTGARSRACSRHLPGLRQRCRELMPDFSVADIVGSPFAIAGYEVARSLGGAGSLQKFRQRLASRGIRLILDFVPNHTGLDDPWLGSRPDFYVQSPSAVPETFRAETPDGPRWIAHGKDPFFPAWVDTAQLDYRNPATRAAMTDQLRLLATVCDGVRCDMAMLVLNDVFAHTWQRFPSAHPLPESEFWVDAIPAVRQARPDFLFLAEAYWDLEARLQEQGFDYTYDKRLYDHLVTRNHPDVQRHLFAVPPRFLQAGAHFLENHDEPRVAALLAWPEHRTAALITLGCPGLRLLHEGQLTGRRHSVSVHCGRRPPESPDPEITAWYERALTALQHTEVGRGESRMLHPGPAWGDNPTWQSFVSILWQGRGPQFDLVVANLASHRSQCYVPLEIPRLEDHNWRLQDLLGDEVYGRRGDDLQRQGLYLDLPEQGAQLFHFEPIG